MVAVRPASRRIFIGVVSGWEPTRASGYASCLKVPGVLEPNPALVGQTVVNDKAERAAGCGPCDGLGKCQPAGACALADLSLQRKSQCPPPTPVQGCRGFLAFPWVGFIDMMLMDHLLIKSPLSLCHMVQVVLRFIHQKKIRLMNFAS